MSFDYRFEPPHSKDFIVEPELFDDEIRDYEYEEFQDQVEEYLTEERYQNWRIQEAYNRRNNL